MPSTRCSPGSWAAMSPPSATSGQCSSRTTTWSATPGSGPSTAPSPKVGRGQELAPPGASRGRGDPPGLAVPVPAPSAEVDLGRQRRSRRLSPSPTAPVPHRPQGKRKAPEERDGARMAQPSPRHAASPGTESWSGWVQGRNMAGHLEHVTQGDPSCNTPRAPDKSKDHEEAGECGHHTLTP